MAPEPEQIQTLKDANANLMRKVRQLRDGLKRLELGGGKVYEPGIAYLAQDTLLRLQRHFEELLGCRRGTGRWAQSASTWRTETRSLSPLSSFRTACRRTARSRSDAMTLRKPLSEHHAILHSACAP